MLSNLNQKMRNLTLIKWFSLISILICSYDVYGQASTNYSKGEVKFKNSEPISAYLWLTTSAGGETGLNVKYYESTMPTTYSAEEVSWFTLKKEGVKYISDSANITTLPEKQFLRVYLEGDYNLFSYETYASTVYYISDLFGNYIVLGEQSRDDISEPGGYGTYEYQLGDLFKSETYLYKKIDNSEFNGSSIAAVLKSFHRKNNRPFREYPPPYIESMFVGVSASYLTLNHQSVLDQEFVSQSLMLSSSLLFGISLNRDKVELSFESSISSGTINHNNRIEVVGIESIFYAESIETSIFSEGFSIGYKPLSSKRFQPYIAFGVNYNIYTNYDRTVVKDVINYYSNTTTSDTIKESSRPHGVAAFVVKGGALFNLNESNSFKVNYVINRFGFNKEEGSRLLSGFSFSYQRKILKF